MAWVSCGRSEPLFKVNFNRVPLREFWGTFSMLFN